MPHYIKELLAGVLATAGKSGFDAITVKQIGFFKVVVIACFLFFNPVVLLAQEEAHESTEHRAPGEVEEAFHGLLGLG